jgi:hypothetical protein
MQRFSRILEKQSSLQMSQVFPFPCIGDQMGFAFQGFYKRDQEPIKQLDSHTTCTCTHKSKNEPMSAACEEVPGPLTNFGPALSEAVSPNRCCSHRVLLPLHFAGLRRGLARYEIFAPFVIFCEKNSTTGYAQKDPKITKDSNW